MPGKRTRHQLSSSDSPPVSGKQARVTSPISTVMTTSLPQVAMLDPNPGPIDLNTLYSALSSISTNMTTQFTTLNSQFSEFKEEIKQVTTKVNELTEGLSYLTKDVDQLKTETIPDLEKKLEERIKAVEQRCLQQELYSRKTNLLFFNIPETDGEDCETVVRQFITHELDIADGGNMSFVNVHRLPTRSDGQRPKPIVVKFVSMRDRDVVLKNARIKLPRSRAGADKKYAVAPHLPAEMQLERRRLVTIRSRMIAEGKDAKIRISGTKVELLVDNQVWKD